MSLHLAKFEGHITSHCVLSPRSFNVPSYSGFKRRTGSAAAQGLFRLLRQLQNGIPSQFYGDFPVAASCRFYLSIAIHIDCEIKTF